MTKSPSKIIVGSSTALPDDRMTIYENLETTARAYGNEDLYGSLFLIDDNDPEYHYFSCNEAQMRCLSLALSLQAIFQAGIVGLGDFNPDQILQSGSHVGLGPSMNCWQWSLLSRAITLLGIIGVPIYPGFGDLLSQEVAENDIQIVFAGNLKDLEALDQVEMKHVVLFENELPESSENRYYYSFQSLLDIGSTLLEEHIATDITSPSPTAEHFWVPSQQTFVYLPGLQRPLTDDIATICYSSGSSGKAKAILLTNRNIMAGAFALLPCPHVFPLFSEFRCGEDQETFYSFLPICHIFCRVLEEIAISSQMCRLAYTSNYTNSALADIAICRPTIMPAVPRVLEKIYAGVQARLDGMFFPIKHIVRWGIRRKTRRSSQGLSCPIINSLLLNRIRELFGGRLRLFVCGGAALEPEIADFVMSISNAQLIRGYGSTETSSAISAHLGRDVLYHRVSVGPPLPPVHVRIHPIDGIPAPMGEILVAGDNVAVYKDPMHNRESFIDLRSDDGECIRYYRTGDVGYLSSMGEITITDRLSIAFKTSLGEFVYPTAVETTLMNNNSQLLAIYITGSPYRRDVVAIAFPNFDALITDPEESREELLMNQENVDQLLQSVTSRMPGIQRKWERPRSIYLAPTDPPLTPSMKLARGAVRAQFRDVIQDMLDHSGKFLHVHDISLPVVSSTPDTNHISSPEFQV